MAKATATTAAKKLSVFEVLQRQEAAREGKGQQALAVKSAPVRVSSAAASATTAEIEERFGGIWAGMVEGGKPLLEALADCEIDSRSFFAALAESNKVKAFYRDVKAAQALLSLEDMAEVLADIEEASDDNVSMGNAVRNAKIQAAKLKIDQMRWGATRLLANLGFGDKPTELQGKVEIIVRRETKKALTAAVQEAASEE